MRGDFWEFLPRRWPWCITDLLIGHSSLSNEGREVLYGTLGSNGLTSDAHTMILSKDSGVGELFILTTDGISSRDHARIGEDTAHKLWQEVDPHIRAILENNILRCLRSATPNSAMTRQSSLETTLQEYLASATFDDDATIGVLVADKVFAHLHAKSKSAEGV